jgi:uncharacterized protein
VHELIGSKRREIVELCRGLAIRRLDLFGSATTTSFDATASDVDVLVEFPAEPGYDHFEAFFALKEGLEEILGVPVDVVSSTGIRNPYFRQSVMATREPLYAA